MTRTDAPPLVHWDVDPATDQIWSSLTPGTTVKIVKRPPVGENWGQVHYPGTIVASTVDEPWIEIEARWTTPTVVQAHLSFEPGDVLREIFSPIHPFNAFAVYRPGGELKGWYANVTYPTMVERGDDRPHVIWHDLYLDIVASPDGEVHVLDEDELEEAKVSERDPGLHERIVSARDELLERFQDRRAPFHESVITDHVATM